MKAVSEQFDNVRLIDPPQPTNENLHREKYLSLKRKYDFCLTINSDEYVSPSADGLFPPNPQ
jgi:hypothetical protein